MLYRALKKNQKDEGSYEFGRDIIPMLIKHNYRVYGYKFCGYWGYTRTIQEYWQSNMDMLGEKPLIDLEKWGFRTNLEHRGIRDYQPLLTGERAEISNSLVYNGCIVEGQVKNSILFPGVHVGKGAVVENSVIFFNNVIGENCRLNTVVADVNSSYARDVIIGCEEGREPGDVTVVGWNNHVPQGNRIGEGATIYPNLEPAMWRGVVGEREVLR